MDWTAVEVMENMAFLANASNLVLYMLDYMHFTPSKSSNAVTNFMGTAFLLALIGGVLSDAFFTTYQVYITSAAIEFLVILLSFFFPFLAFPLCFLELIDCLTTLLLLALWVSLINKKIVIPFQVDYNNFLKKSTR